MRIVVNVRPEVEAELSRQAAAQGIEIGEYAASLLEEAAHAAERPKKLNHEQLEKTLRLSRRIY
jgi:hypothetical protein